MTQEVACSSMSIANCLSSPSKHNGTQTSLFWLFFFSSVILVVCFGFFTAYDPDFTSYHVKDSFNMFTF